MKNTLPVPTISADLFECIHDRQLVAEASTLGAAFRFGRLYNDACDEGFAVQAKSGRTSLFFLAETLRDAEGGVQGWILQPVSPACPVRKITVFND